MEIAVIYGYASSIVFCVGFNQGASKRERAFDWRQAAGDMTHLTGGK